MINNKNKIIFKYDMINYLNNELENTPLDIYNEYTLQDSKSYRKAIYKLINYIKNL